MVSDTDARADAVAIAAGSAELEDQPGVVIWAGVLPKLRRLAHCADHDIDLAIVIEVRESRSAMDARALEILACLVRDVAKSAIAGIGENAVGEFVFSCLEGLDGVVDMGVRGEKVFPTVIVEIE